jgi:hypothetical protein
MKKYYKGYFIKLATQNLDIAHTENDPAFFFIKDRFNLEEFDNAIRSAGHTPAVLLENYSFDKEDSGSAKNYWKFLSCRFNVLAKAEVGNEASIDEAQTYCESIAEEIIDKMREQLQDGMTFELTPGDKSPRIFFPVQNIKGDFIGPISTDYYGVTVGFTWKTKNASTSNPAKWQQ